MSCEVQPACLSRVVSVVNRPKTYSFVQAKKAMKRHHILATGEGVETHDCASPEYRNNLPITVETQYMSRDVEL